VFFTGDAEFWYVVMLGSGQCWVHEFTEWTGSQYLCFLRLLLPVDDELLN
jgi:hypothetical protein